MQFCGQQCVLSLPCFIKYKTIPSPVPPNVGGAPNLPLAPRWVDSLAHDYEGLGQVLDSSPSDSGDWACLQLPDGLNHRLFLRPSRPTLVTPVRSTRALTSLDLVSTSSLPSPPWERRKFKTHFTHASPVGCFVGNRCGNKNITYSQGIENVLYFKVMYTLWKTVGINM